MLINRLGRIALAFLFFSARAALADVQVSEVNNEVIYNVNIDGLAVQPSLSNPGFQGILLEGVEPKHQGILYQVGFPELPVIRFYVEGSGSISVQAGPTQEAARLARRGRVVPNQASLVKLPNAARSFVINQAIYEQAEFYPAISYAIENAGSVRFKQRRLVTLIPASYSPQTGALKLIRSFRVAVQGDKDPARGVGAEGATVAVVLGAKFAASPAVGRYAKLREDQGFKVKTLVYGTDVKSPEDLRAALQALLADPEAPLSYALIVGDAEDVPGHRSIHISGVTDHYYRAIDTNDYEDDINGPDIGLGRISAQDEAQLLGIIAKIERYEQQAFRDDTWLRNVSFLATSDSYHYEVAEGSHNYVIDKYTSPLGYLGTFPGEREAGGDRLFAISMKAARTDVLRRLAEGRAIVEYSGHGGITSWSGPEVRQNDVRNLSHAESLPFVISNACLTGHFTSPESFGETWSRHPQGAIFFWGSMDLTYWTEDDLLERSMFDGIFKSGLNTFAAITHHAQSDLWRVYGGQGRAKYYWETYVSLGDTANALLSRDFSRSVP